MQSYQSPESVQAAARQRLESIVANGVRNAGPVIERILSQVPEDRIVKSEATRVIVNQDGSLHMNSSPMHPNATSQLVERLGIPTGYASELRDFTQGNADRRARGYTASNEWRRSLLEHTIAEHLAHANARYLVRAQAGQVRAVLSDRFRRLDSRPLLDAFVGACNTIGAVPTEGLASDLRASVRAIIPRVYEPIPGEHMVFGLSWTNSDFGAGTYAISAFTIRLVCLNGMVGESAMKQVHLGNRLPDDLEFSAETYRADAKTFALATGDTVKSLLGERAIDARVNAIQEASGKEVSVAEMLKKVGKILGKSEIEQVKRAFEGSDTLMLPAGKTAWRFSNALSWVANNVEDPERRIELQAAAGAVVKAA